MSRALITESFLTGIANAIRAKLGVQDTYTPPQMAAAIESIPTGGITPTGTVNISQNGTHDVTQYASANVNVSGGGGGVVRIDHNIYTYTPNVVASGAMSAGFAFTVSKTLIISKIRVWARAALVSAHIMDGSDYLASLTDVATTAYAWNDLTLTNPVTLEPGKNYIVWYSHKTEHPAAWANVAAPYIPFINYLYSVYAAAADTVPNQTESGTMMGADLYVYGIEADE